MGPRRQLGLRPGHEATIGRPQFHRRRHNLSLWQSLVRPRPWTHRLRASPSPSTDPLGKPELFSIGAQPPLPALTSHHGIEESTPALRQFQRSYFVITRHRHDRTRTGFSEKGGSPLRRRSSRSGKRFICRLSLALGLLVTMIISYLLRRRACTIWPPSVPEMYMGGGER